MTPRYRDIEGQLEIDYEASELAYLAVHDPLTDLLNSRGLEQQLELFHEQYPGRYARIDLDLDGLKTINDTLGHPAGNQHLIKAANTLQACLRVHPDPETPRPLDAPALARASGDEFSIALAGIDNEESLQSIITRIKTALDEAGTPASVAGILHKEGMSLEELQDKADKAMYQAKKQRKLEKYNTDQREIFRTIGILAVQNGLEMRDLATMIAILREEDEIT